MSCFLISVSPHTAITWIYLLSLHDALPIYHPGHERCCGHDGAVFGLDDGLFGAGIHPWPIHRAVFLDGDWYLHCGEGRGIFGADRPDRFPSNLGLLRIGIPAEPADYFWLLHVDFDGCGIRADVCSAWL